MFVVIFSLTTGRTTVHAPSCRHSLPRRGYTRAEVEGATATVAGRRYEADEDSRARGLAPFKVCRCAKHRVEVA